MKIAVVCANGRVGKLVVKEAVNRGLDVTAIAKKSILPLYLTDQISRLSIFRWQRRRGKH